LRRLYRDRLRAGTPGLVVLHLTGDPALVGERLRARKGHFMPPALLRSQFDTLEPLDADEPGFAVRVERPIEEIVADLLKGIAAL
jgi:gluconokinase